MSRRPQGNENVRRHKVLNPLGECGWPFLSKKQCNNCKKFDLCYDAFEKSKTEAAVC